jgi:aspartyl-tRNA(Asn)/glutamyl-tRNA(Gln) amidotransferase subunit A
MNFKNDRNLTIAEMAPLIRRRKVSPVELTDFFLERISRFNPSLNAFLTVTADLARKQSRQAEKEIAAGKYRGALHGIPISLKDLFYTRGVRTTAGSKILRRFVPRENAFAVERLFRAGAVLLGKTNLHEFAYGVTSINPHFGAVRNPWDPDRIAGGSSGGSAAAVSAGLCLASLGTDTGGSIRIPSAACGIVGLKPTRGLIPLDGVIPLAFSLDHAGPMCRSVQDAALMMNALVNATPEITLANYARDLRDGVRGLRIGLPKNYFFAGLKGEIRTAVLEACRVLERLGARIEEVRMKGVEDTARLVAEITVAEALSFHWHRLRRRPGDYGPDLRERMQKSMDQPTVVYLHAQEKRREITRAFSAVLEKVDVLVAPTLPVAAPLLVEKEVRVGRKKESVRGLLLRFTRPANLTGLPSISIPCGFSPEKMPLGLQLLGRSYDEATLLRVARSYEKATPWHEKFPSQEFFSLASPRF